MRYPTTDRRPLLDTGSILVQQLVPHVQVVELVRAGDDLAAAGDDVHAVHRHLCSGLRAIGATGAALWVRGSDPRALHPVHVSHPDPVVRREVQDLLTAAVDGRTGEVGPPLGPLVRHLAADHREHLTDVDGPWCRSLLSPRLRDGLRRRGLTELLVVSLPGAGGPVGLVVAAGPTPFKVGDLDYALILARRAGLALENAHLISQVRDQAAVTDVVSDAVVATDVDLRVTTWNPAAARIYGIPVPSALGRRVHELFADVGHDPADDDGSGTTARPHDVAIGQGTWAGRIRQRTRAGVEVDVDTSITVRRDARGAFAGLVWVNRDLTAEIAARVAARTQERFTRELMNALDNRAAVVSREGLVQAANARWVHGLGDRDRCLCGPVPEGADWLASLRGTGLAEVARFADEVQGVLTGGRQFARFECRCPEAGADRATAVEVAQLQGVDDGAVVVQSDVSWRRRLEDELTHRATHDELTGLPNRAALRETLHASLRRLGDGAMVAVLFCDLDGFKDINDGLGHAVGDQVLVAVSRRLRQRCRAADVVARFGGDEFVVVMPVPDVASARALAERLVEALSEPVAVGDAEVAPGASIGVTVVDRVPEGDDPVGVLLRDADTAMYHAKGRGRGRHELFDTGLRVHASARLEYASALRRAVSNHELQLQFQTRRRCTDRTVAGVEALVRWNHSRFGQVPPSTFIPIAERTGRIVEVGGWALGRALTEVADLPDRRLTVGVNVSPRQLQSAGLVELVDTALAGSGLEPWRLVLEITEGALVDDPDAARTVLTDLRRLGVAVALDDFGTGWSSLSYLRTLPVDVVKIDRSFVADVPHDPDACALVAAVLGLGHGMGLRVVAEGVERHDQLRILRDMGCDEYQGFLDGLPGSLDDVLAPQP